MVALLLFFGALRVAGQSVTVVPSATTYSASGGSIVCTVQLQYQVELGALGLQLTAPPGWAFGELGGANRPQIAPSRGTTGGFDFAFTNMPGSPATFTFTVTYGAGLSGPQGFTGIVAIMRPAGGGEALRPTAPDVVLQAATGGGPDPGGAVAPTISSQPVGATLSEGQSLTLTVIASGSAPVSYLWRKDGQAIAGATASNYTLSNVTAASAGAYTVVVSNSAGSVTSSAAVVIINSAIAGPAIVTPPQGAAVADGTPVTLSVVATGTGTLSYQWRRDGAPIGGATAATLRLAGALTESGSYTVIVSNAGGSVTSVPVLVTFSPTSTGIVISQQPQAVAASAGDTVTLQVTATASAALTYQWFKDGVALAGQTSNRLTLSNVATADAAEYRVELTAGSERASSAPARVTVGGRPAAPIIGRQPTSIVAAPSTVAMFSISVSGIPVPTFQWRKNGTAISGATSATLTLSGVQAADAAGYDVVVTNALGSVMSSLAQLVVQTTPAAPAIMRQPASVSGLAGRAVALAVAATGVPAPTYQWFKDGVALEGATTATFQIASLASSFSGSYMVTVRNDSGTAQSQAAVVRVLARSYAGAYFGTVSGGGNFALQVRADNSGSFLAFTPGQRTAYVSRDVAIDDRGGFRFSASAVGAGAAGGVLAVEGTISEAGDVSASATGGASFTLAGRRSAAGATSAFAGYYQAAAAGAAAQLLAIVGSSGEAVALFLGATVDGGSGTVDANGRLLVTTLVPQTISLTITGEGGGVSGAATIAGQLISFSGHNENSAALAEQRLVNISTRTTAGNGDAVAIVGFVIEGLEAKPVLIRAVGPALGAFGVGGVLGAPRLELLRGQASLAVNAGWSSGTAGSSIAAAGGRAGAFTFAPGSEDSAILTTLAPGLYTAVVSAADERPGIGLIEIYDLSGASQEQRLVNISTRATAGSGDATLIAGFVVGGAAPKRVLVRAAGPALAAFGISSALARPVLRIFSGETVVTQNAGWSTGVEGAAIADAATRAGAFAFAGGSADAAILINLAPGAYTAQVSSATGETGIALLEVYEVH